MHSENLYEYYSTHLAFSLDLWYPKGGMVLSVYSRCIGYL